MRVARTIADVREAVRGARRVGFVPTMGWFHEGHLSLMRAARAECDLVVVSLFVNPAQFNDPRDLDAYPRGESRDAEMARAVGVDLLFAPSVEELYPAGFSTTVSVSGLTDVLEGASRGASHFHGVTTIVAKLLNIVQPHVAYFGQKDAQQALIVKRMVRDLDIPTHIDVCPTVRESDGLAMSSRNVRLSADDRTRALALRRGLDAAKAAMEKGERNPLTIERAGADRMQSLGVPAEYFAVVSPSTLAAPSALASGDELLIAVAAHVGPVRLIDNDLLTVP